MCGQRGDTHVSKAIRAAFIPGKRTLRVHQALDCRDGFIHRPRYHVRAVPRARRGRVPHYGEGVDVEATCDEEGSGRYERTGPVPSKTSRHGGTSTRGDTGHSVVTRDASSNTRTRKKRYVSVTYGENWRKLL